MPESDFLIRDARVPRQQPSTRLQAVVGETKTPVLLVRHRNQRITIESTPILSNCTSQSTNNALDEYKYQAVFVLQRTG